MLIKEILEYCDNVVVLCGKRKATESESNEKLPV